MDISQGHITRRRRPPSTSKSKSRSRLTLDAPAHRTSTFLLQLLVCILSASTLATAQTNTETDPELAGDEASCLFGVDQKEINRLFSEGQLSASIYIASVSLSPAAFWANRSSCRLDLFHRRPDDTYPALSTCRDPPHRPYHLYRQEPGTLHPGLS
jgi:hypothetical protein